MPFPADFSLFPLRSDTPTLFAAAAAVRRPRAASSDGNSRVSYALHVVAWNWRSSWPSRVVDVSSERRVGSVCSRSFASICQVPSSNSNLARILSCSLGSSPSKTGIAHWDSKIQLGRLCMKKQHDTHLKKILKIAACELFHSRSVVIEPSDSVASKRRDLSISTMKVVRLIQTKCSQTTYRSFKIWIPSPPAAYKTRIKCVNTAFHTPNSNSCSKSGTNSL